MPESDLSFDFTAALENQFLSLLCACFPNAPVKPKSCAILSGIIKTSFLSEVTSANERCNWHNSADKKVRVID